MNNRQKQMDQFQKKNTIPYYNRKECCWKVRVDGRLEKGCLEYVCCEFTKNGLFYPYRTKPDTSKWREHSHTFEGVLADLIHNPKTFSIKGFEEYYSKQEIEFLDAIQNKLLNDFSKNP